MIIEAIYYGKKFVDKIYRNGKVIWEYDLDIPEGKPVELSSFLDLFSNGVFDIETFGITEIESESESFSDSNSLFKLCPIVRLKANVNSQTDSVIYFFPALAKLANHYENCTTDNSIGNLGGYLARIAKPQEDRIIENSSFSAIMGKVIVVKGEEETYLVEDQVSSATPFRAIEVLSKGDSYEIHDYVKGIGIPINNILLIDGYESKHTVEDINSDLILYPTIDVIGKDGSTSASDGLVGCYEYVKVSSSAKSTSNGEGKFVEKDYRVMKSSDGINITKKASMVVYSPPLLRDGILYIPTAYSATLNGGILEVS